MVKLMSNRQGFWKPGSWVHLINKGFNPLLWTFYANLGMKKANNCEKNRRASKSFCYSLFCSIIIENSVLFSQNQDFAATPINLKRSCSSWTQVQVWNTRQRSSVETDSGPRTVADQLLPYPHPIRKSGACYAFSQIPSLIYKTRGAESHISDSALIVCNFVIPGYLHSIQTLIKYHQCQPVQKVSPVHQLDIMLKAWYWAHISLPGEGGKRGHKFISCYLTTAARCPLPSPAGETGKSHIAFFFFLLILAVWREDDRGSFQERSLLTSLSLGCTVFSSPAQDWLSDRDLGTSILILEWL